MGTLRRFWRQVWYGALTSAYVIAATGGAFALLVVAIGILVLFQTREDAVVRAREAARNLAIIAQRDIERNFELYALSLQAVVDGLADPQVMRLPSKLRHEVLFGHAMAASRPGAILVLDANGGVLIDSGGEGPGPGRFSSRKYFTVQRDDPGAGLYISAPYMSQFLHGPAIALSRRVSRPDGSFAGVVVLRISLDYFRRLFASLDIGPNGSVALIGKDGIMYMRQPYDVNVIGRDLAESSTFRHFRAAPQGAFFSASAVDGTRRLFYFKNFPKLPFIMIVAQGQQDIYGSWSRRAAQIGSLIGVLAVGFVVLAFLMSLQLRRRVRMEEELLLLARTDGLTGLSNRRMLDETLAREWARARRGRSSLALLFIDIDWFKSYNDTYGHQAGDRALAAVARCIGRSGRRPGDSAARYGGEEFMVVLPETSLEGAASLAEKVRVAVSELGIAHAASEYGCITVSIGVAAGVPQMPQMPQMPQRDCDVASVMLAADKALNSAKSAGRNRIAVAGGST